MEGTAEKVIPSYRIDEEDIEIVFSDSDVRIIKAETVEGVTIQSICIVNPDEIKNLIYGAYRHHFKL